MIRNLLDSLYRRHPFDYLIAWRNPDVMLKDGSLSDDKRVLSDGQRRVTALVASRLGPDTEPRESGVEEAPDDKSLLEELGVAADDAEDLTPLVHVRTREEIRAAEEIAKRNPCPDFAGFKALFDAVQRDLASGARQTIPYKGNADAKGGDRFILEGQKAVVAAMGEPFVSDYGRPARHLRVVYDNSTESDLLLRSLQRALNKNKTSRRITEPNPGLLFSCQPESYDLPPALFTCFAANRKTLTSHKTTPSSTKSASLVA